MKSSNFDTRDPVTRITCSIAESRSTIDLLRARTATLHRGLESQLQIVNRLSDAEKRGPLIAGYFALHGQAEVALKSHLWGMTDLAFPSRVRSYRISGKTGSLRHGKFLFTRVFPAIGTKAEALGALYVLEGSTLGGKTILKALRSQGVSTDDLHFLDPYGKDAGMYWRAFLKVLERETSHNPSTMNECVSGAMKAFAFAATCLREERIN